MDSKYSKSIHDSTDHQYYLPSDLTDVVLDEILKPAFTRTEAEDLHEEVNENENEKAGMV